MEDTRQRTPESLVNPTAISTCEPGATLKSKYTDKLFEVVARTEEKIRMKLIDKQGEYLEPNKFTTLTIEAAQQTLEQIDLKTKRISDATQNNTDHTLN